MTNNIDLNRIYGNMKNKDIIEVIKNPRTTLTHLVNVVTYNSETIIAALEKQISKVEYYCPDCGKRLRPIYFRRQDIMELSEEKKGVRKNEI